MKIEFEWVKDIPKQKIDMFEDKTVYNVAVYTRDFTKNIDAFPYLTGTLRREEVAAPIWGSNKVYGLESGVDYAKFVWEMSNVKWTNKGTEPQWYYNVFKTHEFKIVNQAERSAIKEI